MNRKVSLMFPDNTTCENVKRVVTVDKEFKNEVERVIEVEGNEMKMFVALIS